MKWGKFQDINAAIKSTGLKIGAFVSSNASDTHGIWGAVNGLCTVEKHRDKAIDLEIRELVNTDNLDYIIIRNAFASEEEFISIKQALVEIEPYENKYPIIKLKKLCGC